MPRITFDAGVADFAQALGQLVRRVRAASAAQELSWTESAVLARLARDGPATTAELARAENMKPQSMGTTVAALEERELVERTPHPTDGRQMNIALTAKGLAVRKSAKDAKRTWLALAIAELDERDRQTLFAAARIMQELANSTPLLPTR